LKVYPQIQVLILHWLAVMHRHQPVSQLRQSISTESCTLVLSNDLLGGIRHGLVPEKQLNAVFAHLANAPPSVLAPKTEFSNQRSWFSL
jgi:hypothetical protein